MFSSNNNYALSFQKIQCPTNLYEDIVEVDERVVLDRQDCCLQWLKDKPVVVGKTNEKVGIL